MQRLPRHIYYELPSGLNESIHGLSGDSKITEVHAYAAQNLLAETYAATFESTEEDGIEPGTFAEIFSLSDDAIEKRRTRMVEALKNGSRYWYIKEYNSPLSEIDKWHGLVKTSPSRASVLQKIHISTPNCFLNDVVVRPDVQRRGYGTALVHAALKYGGYKTGKILALKGFEGNDVANEWFSRLGLVNVKTEDASAFEVDANHEIPYLPFTSKGNTTIGGIVKELEGRAVYAKSIIA